jgi:hypothetical protein
MLASEVCFVDICFLLLLSLLALLCPCRPELQHTTPVPRDEFVDYNDQDPAWVNNAQLQGAAADLETANKDGLVHAKK